MDQRLYFKNVTIFDGAEFFRGSLTTDGARIARIVRGGEIPDGGTPTATGEAVLIMPGMVNFHTHVPMTLFKGVAEDLPLKDWLEKRIFPLEAKFISREMCRIAGQWGMAEMLLSGVTAFADMYFFEEDIAAAAKEIGIKAAIGEGVINFPAPNGMGPDETIAYTAQLAERYKDDPWVFPCCAPHSPYLTDEKYLLTLAEISKKYRIPLHIHMAETRHEQEAYRKQHGEREFERFDELGLLSDRFIAAHCVWVDGKEMDLMARRGVTVAHCPSSNLKLGSGIAPVAEMVRRGVNVAVATDGSASNNNLDVLKEAQLAAKVQKGIAHDPTVLPALDVLKMVTASPGRALGRSFGRLVEGGAADIVQVHLDTVGIAPVHDPAAALLYAFSPSAVAAVWVNGRQTVTEGKILTVDMAALKKELDRMSDAVRRSL
ncbi:MAG TPA: amidohydrolase [bacterium]|nr:amidohydrolase [bacterium]